MLAGRLRDVIRLRCRGQPGPEQSPRPTDELARQLARSEQREPAQSVAPLVEPRRPYDRIHPVRPRTLAAQGEQHAGGIRPAAAQWVVALT